MTERIERQIARFAPGFYDRVLVRRGTSAAELESKNANLIGGAITGGANDLWQIVARPTLSAVPYRTPIEGMFICIRLTNHTADRGSDLPRLFSAGGPRSGRELGDSMHWHIGQSR